MGPEDPSPKSPIPLNEGIFLQSYKGSLYMVYGVLLKLRGFGLSGLGGLSKGPLTAP